MPGAEAPLLPESGYVAAEAATHKERCASAKLHWSRCDSGPAVAQAFLRLRRPYTGVSVKDVLSLDTCLAGMGLLGAMIRGGIGLCLAADGARAGMPMLRGGKLTRFLGRGGII